MKFVEIAIILNLCSLILGGPIHHNTKNDFELNIIHTNDMHARFEETNKDSSPCNLQNSQLGKCYGGFARLATVIRQVRNSSSSTLFLNGGDTYQGTPYYAKFKWRVVAKFLNILHPDAASLGNHEFDDGIDGLVPLLRKITFPIVSSNLDLSLEPALQSACNLKKSAVFSKDGKKITVIGFLTPETKIVSQSGNVQFRDEVDSIREEIARLKKAHEDLKIFIALGHSGYVTDIKIASEIEDVDLVIGGHSNTFLYNGEQPDDEVPEGLYPTEVTQKSGRKSYVVQAYAYTKYLGNLSIAFDYNGEITKIEGSPIIMDSKIEQAPDVLEELQVWKNVLIKDGLLIPIGFTKVYLNGNSKKCRYSECNLGSLIADAMVEYVADKQLINSGNSADTSFICAGAIRSSINKHSNEPITLGDIMNTLPFKNLLYIVKLSGKVIHEMLEHSFHSTDDFGGFMQMSGIRVTADMARPPYSRIKPSEIYVLCSSCDEPKYKPLRMEANYTVLLTDFTYEGADGFSMLKGSEYKDTGVHINDTLIEYIKKHSPIEAIQDGRIILK